MLVVINVEMQHPQLFQQIPPAVGMTTTDVPNIVMDLPGSSNTFQLIPPIVGMTTNVIQRNEGTACYLRCGSTDSSSVGMTNNVVGGNVLFIKYFTVALFCKDSFDIIAAGTRFI